MKQPNKAVIILISIPIVILLFFSSNIFGYFRFKSYCSSEGGLRVYEKLEKNVVWLAKDKYDAHVAAQLKYVGFVRYIDKKDGKTYDTRFVGRGPQSDSSFETIIADHDKPVKYFWKIVHENIPNELRLERFGYEISDNKKIVATYLMLGYERYERSRTLFNAPSEEFCFLKPARNIDHIDGWILALNTAFKN